MIRKFQKRSFVAKVGTLSSSGADKKEYCVLCHSRTDVPMGMPVSWRKRYIEGSGQLCEKCFQELYGGKK